jgi:hypothetical protein
LDRIYKIGEDQKGEGIQMNFDRRNMRNMSETEKFRQD